MSAKICIGLAALFCILFASFPGLSKETNTQQQAFEQSGEQPEALLLEAQELARKDPATSLQYCNDLISRANTLSARDQFTCVYTKAIAQRNLGDYPAAIQSTLEALQLAEELQNDTLRMRAKNSLALNHKKLSKPDKANLYFGQALELALSIADTTAIAGIKCNLGNMYRHLGETERALEEYLESASLYEGLGLAGRQANVFQNLGNLFLQSDNAKRSFGYFNQALAIYQNAGDSIGLAKLLGSLGSGYLQAGQFVKAREVLEQALTLNQRLHNPDNEASIHQKLAALAEAQGNYQEALGEYELAGQLLETSQDQSRKVSNLINLGSTHLNLGNAQLAQTYYFRALAKADSLGTEAVKKQIIYENLAETSEALGLSNEALTYTRKASEIKDSLQARNTENHIRKIEMAYEAEQQEQEYHQLQQESALKEAQLKTRQAVLIAIVLALLTLVIGTLFALNRQKQKAKQESIALDTARMERKRIGSELHDNMGAIFMQIGLYFENIEEKVQQSFPDLDPNFERANALLKKAANMVRQVTHDLSSETLANEGLLAALQELQDSVNQRSGLEMTTLAIGFEDDIPGSIAITIHQCVRELVNNAIKHAAAKNIEVVLVNRDHEIEVRVEDNGQGIDQSSEAYRNGIGLNNIRSRLKNLAGTFALSTSNEGTIVTLLIPTKHD